MSPGPGGRRRAPALLVAAACLALLLPGCTYSREEPGLFGRNRPSPAISPTNSDRRTSAPPTDPSLPVLAEALWTSADGLDLQARIAVHAVRVIEGATVVDWSITPVRVPNLQPGDPVPSTVDLGLSRSADERPRIDLLDSDEGRLYRPSVGPAGRPHCVCTPLSAVQRRLRVGHTTLLQVAYPPLPRSVSTIDVVVATVPPFWRVPVTRPGRVPVAVGPTELGRPARAALVAGERSEMFRYGRGEQVFRVQPNQVLAGDSYATLEWTIHSVTGGDGLESAATPPFGDSVSGKGPVLVVDTKRGERILRPRLVRSEPGGSADAECLCSPLAGWTRVLRRPDKQATVVTTYPPLPADTRRVQVRLAGLAELAVPVRPAPDASSRLAGTRPWSPTTWRPSESRSATGWAPGDWPTPVPSADQLPETTGSYPLVR